MSMVYVQSGLATALVTLPRPDIPPHEYVAIVVQTRLLLPHLLPAVYFCSGQRWDGVRVLGYLGFRAGWYCMATTPAHPFPRPAAIQQPFSAWSASNSELYVESVRPTWTSEYPSRLERAWVAFLKPPSSSTETDSRRSVWNRKALYPLTTE